MKNRFLKLVKEPKIVIILTVFFTVLISTFIPRIKFDADLSNLIPNNDPVIEELKIATEDFGSQSLILVVLKSEDILTSNSLKKIDELSVEISSIDGVFNVVNPLNVEILESSEWGMEIIPICEEIPETEDQITSFKKTLDDSVYKDLFISRDGKAALIMITPDSSIEPGKENRLAGELAVLVDKYQGPEEIYLVGDVYAAFYAEKAMKKDVLLLTPLVFVVLVLVLYYGFKTLSGVVLPMITVALSSLFAVGFMAAFGVKISIITVLVPVILLAIGSAQGIHIINRFYSYVREGNTKKEALELTMKELTNPILMTSLTTAAGFLSLLSSPIPPIKYFGIFTSIGVLIAMLLSLYFIPAVLLLIPVKIKQSKSKNKQLTLRLDRLTTLVVKNPKITIISFLVICLLGIRLSFNLKTEGNMLKYFEKNSPVIQGTDLVEEEFGGTLQLSIVVDTFTIDGVKEPELLQKLEKIEAFLEKTDNVYHPKSLATVVKEINKAITGEYVIPETKEAVAQELLIYSFQGGSSLDYFISHSYDKTVVNARLANKGSEEIKKVLNTIEDFLKKEFGSDSSVKITLTGMPKVMYRVMDQFAKSQILSLLTSAFLVSIIVSFIMKSVVYGLISIVPLISTIAVNFGYMSIRNIPLDAVTSMISGIAIGIGVDYSIHYISTFREEMKKDLSLEEIAVNASLKSGSGIALNAITLFLGFLSLVVSNFRAIKLFGFLTAMTMLLSAFSALTLLPAILITWHKRDKRGAENE